MSDVVPPVTGRQAQRAVVDRSAQLRRLELRITLRLDGLLSGDHLGLLPGPGSEAGDAREYQPGDDVRRMDWNLTARSEHAHVRDTEADRELETWVVVDTSASLDFGTTTWEKRDLALVPVAAIGFLTTRHGNRLGAVIGGGDRPLVVPARTGAAHVHQLLRRLADSPRRDPRTGSGSSLDDALRLLDRVRNRRGVTVVVSDFLEPQDSWVAPLRRTARRHQTLAAELVDPRELELPDVGLLHLVDPETGAMREVQTSSTRLRQRYAEAAREQREEIAQAIRGCRAAHVQLRTDRDWLLDLVRFVAHQRRVATVANRPEVTA
jgi:uncharacterized protein (DUF58 family)